MIISAYSVRSQNCMKATYVHWTNPSGDNVTYLLTITWTADGQKHLNIVVNDGVTSIMFDCIQSNSTGQSTGTKVYTIIHPGGGSVLSVHIEGWTGTCNHGTICNTQDIPLGGSLAVKFVELVGHNVGTSTIIEFQTESTDPTHLITINFTMPNGEIVKYNFTFLNEFRRGEIWMITINNATGVYTLKRK